MVKIIEIHPNKFGIHFIRKPIILNNGFEILNFPILHLSLDDECLKFVFILS